MNAVVTSSNAFAPALLAWFDVSGRKHLPWQQQRTPYRVWVSEIMLQQTQVATAIPYYERFMQRFADVAALAAAPLDEVLHLWTGLGYYARARNLHRAAQVVVSEFAGEFPTTHAELNALPGIGRSTASAILALSRDERHAILDGNVKRVLARYFAIAGYPGEKRIETQLWLLAAACTPHTRIADYTQAIMDLGATLCTRSKPRCGECPVRGHCLAYAQGLQATLPTRKPKVTRPQREAFALVARNAEGALLLEQRPPAGLWGGLWVCPQFDTRVAMQDWIDAHLRHDGTVQTLPTIDHAFTHFDLRLQPTLLTAAMPLATVADSASLRWYDPKSPARIGLAKPVLDILKALP
jgi:A/G-specific adenine glycosylase